MVFKSIKNTIYNISNDNSNSQLWHKCFGHASNKKLEKLANKNMVEGMPYKISNSTKICETCLKRKQHKLPFKKLKPQKGSRILDIVHTDLCGPISPTALKGFKYFIIFIDDFSHFTIIYLLKEKSETFNIFKEYVNYVMNRFNININYLYCDNGGEYTSNNFKTFCSEKGILIHYTIPDNPQQNGIAERMNCTIVEKVRSMLAESKLPKLLWAEAALTATYLINRLPYKDSIQTPTEIWYSKKPNVENLRVFGCVAYVLNKNMKQKFDEKSNKCVMLGYTFTGYKLWDIKNKRVIFSRDVIFDENSNYLEEQFSSNQDDNSDLKIDPSASEKDSSNQLSTDFRRSERQRKAPDWLKDYELNSAVLNAEKFLNETPSTYNEIFGRPDQFQ